MALKSGGGSSLIHKQGVQVFHGVVYEGALLSTLLRSLLIPVANNPQGLTLGVKVVLGKKPRMNAHEYFRYTIHNCFILNA